MAKKKIIKITPEQKALIPVYCEKWRQIALSTEPIDPQKAGDAVRNIYSMYGLNQPDILFFPSLYAACSDDLNLLKSSPPLRRIIRLHKAVNIFSSWLLEKPLALFLDPINKLESALRESLKEAIPAPLYVFIKTFYCLSVLFIFPWLILSLVIGVSLLILFENLYSRHNLE
ncbi:MAG: hypothetical protein KME27_24555 [Lyngbya sp. HA4199-MV5]|jgi:hypothetical protein|nr:hypothetical protein [Lyngbya sp. HA4199-MV5]